jgi:hypothetical protein
VSYRLRSQRDPALTLTLSSQAWQALLSLAETYGWNPMGTARPAWADELGLLPARVELERGGYTARMDRLVLLEDALNLADALQRAFLAGQPLPEHPYAIVFRSEWEEGEEETRPGLGALQALTALCSQGAFWIERC